MRKSFPPPTCTGPISNELLTSEFYLAVGTTSHVEDQVSASGNAFSIDTYLCLYVSMRTTLDIPDETYLEVNVFAAEHGTTLRQLVL
jgi:hypothetical protein